MPELKAVLGSEVDMTVFRKLQPLGYRTSYSHRGKFYTLDEVPRFFRNPVAHVPQMGALSSADNIVNGYEPGTSG